MKAFNNLIKSSLGLSLTGRGRWHREVMIRQFVEGNNLSTEAVSLELLYLSSEWNKSIFVQAWLEEEGRRVEDFERFLPFVTNIWSKSRLVTTWLEEEGRSAEDFELVLNLLPNDNQEIRRSLSLAFLEGARDDEDRYNKFLAVVRKDGFGGSQYNAAHVSRTFSLHPTLQNRFVDLCEDLYPHNERSQTDLFMVLIGRQTDQLLNANKENLKSFICGLQDDGFALQSLRAVQKKIQFTPLEILETAKGRFGAKYQSIKSALNQQDLEQSFIKAGLETLTEIFGNIPEGTTVCDIFSYYDLKEDFKKFVSLLMPEVVEKIRVDFCPSDQSPYILEQEFTKLKTLVEDLELPSLSILGEYLNGVVTEKMGSTQLDEEKINQFYFGRSRLLEANFSGAEESKDDYSKAEEAKNDAQLIRLQALTKDFKALLRDQNPSVEKVTNFFTEVLGGKGEINEGQEGKLTNFFKYNKNLLAILFKKDEGLDSFALIVRELTSGCVANIATQFRNALYASLLEDSQDDQVLFSLFQEKIANPILNSGGDHLTGLTTGINIFTDLFIAQNYISPNGLVKGLAKEFYDSNQEKPQVRATDKRLVEILGQNNAAELFDKVAFKELDKDIPAEIVSYFILQKVGLENLLESKYLTSFREKIEGILGQLPYPLPQDPALAAPENVVMQMNETLEAAAVPEPSPQNAAAEAAAQQDVARDRLGG